MKENLSSLTIEEEKIILIASVYVGKSSAEYWHKEFEKWVTSFNPTIPETAGRIPRVISADMVGGGIGAVSGAITGATGGTIAIPGIGTVAGATAVFFVGGAIGGIRGSAAAALTSLLTSWFGF